LRADQQKRIATLRSSSDDADFLRHDDFEAAVASRDHAISSGIIAEAFSFYCLEAEQYVWPSAAQERAERSRLTRGSGESVASSTPVRKVSSPLLLSLGRLPDWICRGLFQTLRLNMLYISGFSDSQLRLYRDANEVEEMNCY
jgi:hypothetical protein